MKRFFVFDRVYNAVDKVDRLISSDTSDRVTYTLNHSNGSLFLGATSLGNNRFFGTGRAVLKFNSLEANLNTDITQQIFGSIRADVYKGLSFAGFGSTSRQVLRNLAVTRYMQNCDNALYCCYKGRETSSHIGLGVKKDQSMCSVALANEAVNVVFTGILNDRGNLVKIAILTGFNMFGCLKADVSMRQLVRFQIGGLLDFKKLTGFAVWDSKGKLNFGAFSQVNDSLSLALKGATDVKMRDVELEVGSILKRKAHLKAKFELGSRSLELVSSFSPRKWVDVSLKSVASMSHRHVVYGWAIDFHNDV